MNIRDRIKAYYANHKSELHVASLSVVAVVAVGSFLLFTHAAGFFGNTEAENGTKSANVTLVSDASASGGSAIKFGSGGSGTNPLSSLPLIPWAGGPSYYNKFTLAKNMGWTSPNFYPIGAWFMRASDQGAQDLYKSMHFNTSFQVEDEADLATLRANGMSAFPGNPDWQPGTESVGWEVMDEPDMNYGAGSDGWSGVEGWNTCQPTQDNGGKCGLTVLSYMINNRFPSGDGRMLYSNLGKGIFPGWEDPADEARFLNSGYTDLISDDIYWYTDLDACTGQQGPRLIPGSGPISPYSGMPDLTDAECHRAGNYGAIVDQMRYLDSLDGKYQPILGFVESGNPFDGGWDRYITGPQMEGAVMSTVIHGADGVIYFKHNFGSSCITTDNFIDCSQTHKTNATTVNGYLQSLAPVLNTQSYKYDFGGGTDTMLKWYNGSAYIFAMGKIKLGGTNTGNLTFTLPSGIAGATSVQVLDGASRTIPISAGKFTDNFAQEYSYHIYKITP
jgi:hypothetical protein